MTELEIITIVNRGNKRYVSMDSLQGRLKELLGKGELSVRGSLLVLGDFNRCPDCGTDGPCDCEVKPAERGNVE